MEVNEITKFDIYDFIYGLQEFTAEEAIDEIAGSGLSDQEIAIVIKVISLNDTFKFSSKK